ncbi:MAG: D-tyrosyl-tRNA(Tyr) deacylase [Oscillospiraceae bacterium]|nr:D-tyrosyl-tRNA(Tyr) deacylase [Oscillospiraceae bacterium]
MKVVLQCCTSGSVTIDGEVNGSVGRGYVALVGITTRDTQAEARLLAEKCVALRVFADDGGKLNLSVKDIAGEMLIISNFTLCADARHGRRPSYINAARPETALPLYNYFVDCVKELGVAKVETGVFGADMKVSICNDGPITIVLDTDELTK